MTNKQTEEVIRKFREKFELHDLGKDEFTLCCNNDDGTCDGGISILKESQGEAERHLKNVEQFILTAIKEAEERVVKEIEDNIKSNIGALTTSPADPLHHSMVAYIKCCKWWEDTIHKSIKESK